MAEKLRKKVFCTGDAALDLIYAVVRQVRLDIHYNAEMTEKDVPPAEFLDEFLDGARDNQSVIVPQRKAPAKHRGRWHA
ncbi:MAG: hypothetical protein IPL32_19550 [Chloracidobacterium sp.]|nr:hypothetical protein [Chloracidobacterium sp.]